MPKVIDRKLDKSITRQVLKEQKEKLERIRIDIVFIQEELGMSSANVFRVKDLLEEFGVIERFVDFLEFKL